MPELPEVEYYRSVIEDNCLGKLISEIQILVPYLLKGTTENGFIKKFKGSKLKLTYRHGKYLFVQSSKKDWLYFHFGLTGELVYEKEIPRFTAVAFKIGKAYLCFADMRKFGRFGIIENPEEFLKEKKWGPDALEISKQEFVGQVGRRAVAIKTILMDQKILAGVGNEYSDEILFRTRIHPEKPASSLSVDQLASMHKIMRQVLQGASKVEAERSKMKKYFFVVNRKAGLTCPNCGGETKSKTVGGRTAYFCPKCQKR
jgi:formamidopyrimidine-DNA glycosylase